MSTVLKAEKFLGYSDLPVYQREPGWLTDSNGFRVMPGGYLQARGGFEQLKPSGGTASDPIAAGIFTGAHQHTRPDAYIIRYLAAATSHDLSQFAYWDIWPTTITLNDKIRVVSDGKFSRVLFYVGQGTGTAPTDPTFAYEYAKAADWSSVGTLTTTSTPFTITAHAFATGEQALEFAIPSDWLPSVQDGIYGYAIQVRVSNTPTALTTKVTQSTQKVYTDSPGLRQIWVSGADATAGTNVGVLKYYGQSSASTVSWQSVSSALFSGNYAPHRYASYKNVLYMVNGKEEKRYSGASYAAAAYTGHALNDVGFTDPTSSGATYNVASAGALTGNFSYAITYGYGPAGEWGESNELQLGLTGGIAAKQVTATLNLTSIPDPGIADKIYVYRTTDLTSVPAGSQGSFPQYRIATLTRDATGTFPTTFTDNTLAFPFPPVELDITTKTPPTRCKFIAVHNNRLFLAGNNQYPGRVWWSDPFAAEAFNTDENFADFTRSTGGKITGMAEFNDQIVVFTEDQAFGIANVDQDIPNIYVIHPGLGSVAPDAITVAYGVMVWMARDGAYVWDGEATPIRISNEMSTVFGKSSVETVGRSRAIVWDRMYMVQLVNQNHTLVTPSGLSPGTWFRYDLVTKTWGFSLGQIANGRGVGPLITAVMPIAHADAGVRHPLAGVIATGYTARAIYAAEQTVQDDGVTYSVSASVHLGPIGRARFVKRRGTAYYKSITSPVLSSSGTEIGYDNVSTANDTAEGGQDYTKINLTFSKTGRGSQDIHLEFSGTPVGATGSYLHAVYLEGELVAPGPMD